MNAQRAIQVPGVREGFEIVAALFAAGRTDEAWAVIASNIARAQAGRSTG